MELRDYFGIIGRRWWIVVLSVVVVGLGIWWQQTHQPPAYLGIASISLVKHADSGAATPNQFTFDNFYALESNELLAKMVNGWLAEPATVADIYTTAKVDLPAQSISRYDRVIKVQGLPGSTLAIHTTAQSGQEAERLAEVATQTVVSRIDGLVAKGVLDPVETMVARPLSESQIVSGSLAMVIGIVAGLILGLILVFFIEYLKPSHSR